MRLAILSLSLLWQLQLYHCVDGKDQSSSGGHCCFIRALSCLFQMLLVELEEVGLPLLLVLNWISMSLGCDIVAGSMNYLSGCHCFKNLHYLSSIEMHFKSALNH